MRYSYSRKVRAVLENFVERFQGEDCDDVPEAPLLADVDSFRGSSGCRGIQVVARIAHRREVTMIKSVRVIQSLVGRTLFSDRERTAQDFVRESRGRKSSASDCQKIAT